MPWKLCFNGMPLRRGKCPLHKIPYSIGKNYTGELFLYCKKCNETKE